MSAYPSARAQHGMAYDSLRNRIWMYGGNFNSSALQDFWYLDLTNFQWVQVAATNPPGVRWGGYFGYDANRDTLVMWAGWNNASVITTIYEYNCATSGPWTLKSPAHTPTIGVVMESSDGFQYDPVRHTLLVFGGRSATPFSNVDSAACWEWNGTDWTQRASGPTAREGHGWIYDSVRQKFLMVGGMDYSQHNLALETWEFDNGANSWTSRGTQGTTGGPTGMSQMIIFQRPSDGKIIAAYGANGNVGGAFNLDPQQWEWNGAAGTWTRNNTVTLPFLRRGVTSFGQRTVSGCWVSSLNCWIGFGGLNDSGTVFNQYQWSTDGTFWNVLTSKRKQLGGGSSARRGLNHGTV